MSPKVISILLSVFALVIIIISTLLGALRGLKRSTFRLVWVVIFGALVFAISGVVADAVARMDISFLNIQQNGTVVSSFTQLAENYISQAEPNLGKVIADNPSILSMITTLICMILSLLVFFVLFWVTKWVLWPIWAILSTTLIKRKKVISKEQQNLPNGIVIPASKETVVSPKKAGYGALVGFAMGAIICIFTFIPIIGISNAVIELEIKTQVEQEDGTTQGIVSTYLGENISCIYSYNDSAICKILTYTGVDAIDSGLGNLLASAKVNNKTVTLQEEIDNLAPIYVDYNKISKINFNALSKDDISTLFPVVNDICDRALSSEMVASIYNECMPYFIDNIVDNPEFFIQLPDLGNDKLNNVLKDVVKSLKEVSVDDFRNDASCLIKMAGEINDADILLDLINENLDFDKLQLNISDSLGEKLSDLFFSMKTVSIILPKIVNPAIEYACKEIPAINYNGVNIDVVYLKGETTLSNEELKTLFKNIISDAVGIIKGVDKNSKIYIDSSSFEYIGDVIDALKNSNLLSNSTYTSLINYCKCYAKSEVKNMSLDANIKDIFLDIIDELDTVDSYRKEMHQWGLAYAMFKDKANEDIDNLLDNYLLLSQIADVVSGTDLYKNSIDNIIDCASKYLSDFVKSNNYSIDTSRFEEVLQSIKRVDSFEEEYGKICELIDFIKDNNGPALEDKNNLQIIGEKIDAAIQNGSIIVSQNNCEILIKSVIEKVEIPSQFEDVTINKKPIKQELIENIDQIVSYATEFECLKMLTESDESSQISDIGKLLDQIISKNSALINRDVINGVVEKEIDEEAKKIEDIELRNIILKMKNNVALVESFETEFNYIQVILDIDFENDDLRTIGQKINQVKASVLINPIIDDVIIYEIDTQVEKNKLDKDLQPVIGKIKLNVSKIVNYESEFNYLNKLLEIDYTEGNLVEVGRTLDSMESSRLLGDTLNDLLKIAFNKASESVDGKYSTVLDDIKSNIDLITDEEVTNTFYSTELGYIDSFITFTNSDDIGIQSIKSYLKDNLLDSNEESKSVLISNNVLLDIAKLGVDSVKEKQSNNSLDETFEKIKNNIDNSKDNIMVILTQLDQLGSDLDSIGDISVDENLTKSEIIVIGETLDNLLSYNAIMSQSAQADIAKYVLNEFKDKTNNSALSGEKKIEIISICDSEGYASYKEQFTDISEVLS